MNDRVASNIIDEINIFFKGYPDWLSHRIRIFLCKGRRRKLMGADIPFFPHSGTVVFAMLYSERLLSGGSVFAGETAYYNPYPGSFLLFLGVGGAVGGRGRGEVTCFGCYNHVFSRGCSIVPIRNIVDCQPFPYRLPNEWSDVVLGEWG